MPSDFSFLPHHAAGIGKAFALGRPQLTCADAEIVCHYPHFAHPATIRPHMQSAILCTSHGADTTCLNPHHKPLYIMSYSQLLPLSDVTNNHGKNGTRAKSVRGYSSHSSQLLAHAHKTLLAHVRQPEGSCTFRKLPICDVLPT